MKDLQPANDSLSPDPCSASCPSRELLDLIGDRWSLLVMRVVGSGVRRNGEIKRQIGGISQKMLTQTLRSLEANGLVRRIDFQRVPPHVEYELTALGQSLRVALSPLHAWVEAHFDDVVAARSGYLAINNDVMPNSAVAA